MKVPTIEELQDSIEFIAYRDTYSRILHEILGFPLAHGRREIDKRLRAEPFRVWFGHTTPASDAAPQIVARFMSPESRNRAGAAIGDANLCREFQEAIEGSGDFYDAHPDANPNFDWDGCRARIRELAARANKS
jgi:hypothetical protein